MPTNKGYLTAKTDNASDEYYTPREAVEPIVEIVRLQGFSTVWCPFDTEESEYVKCLKENGINVIATHIDNGQNFFYYEPEEDYGCIISNPPFSIKDDILKRLNELNKPYAILLPLPSLQGQKRFEYLKDSEVMIFNKRINFYKDKEHTIMARGVAFASVYVCKNFLPEKLMFEEIK
jgi:type I restriction-modification system DNA methylase subunit